MVKQKEHTGGTPAVHAKVDSPAEQSQGKAQSARHSGHNKWRPPVALIVAFLGVLAVGIILGATRERRTEVAARNGINNCEASASALDDGLNDYYGVVLFRQQRGEVTTYLSLCETDPGLALRIFRDSLDNGTPSGKMVALYSAQFLAANKHLEDSDFQRILAQLKPATPSPSPPAPGEKESDLRKVAQRVVSDLTLMNDAAHPSRYEVVPAGLPPPVKDSKDKEGEAKPHKVEVKEEKLRDSGKTMLNVRWSSPVVAVKWWEALATGHWDKDLQRFVIQP